VNKEIFASSDEKFRNVLLNKIPSMFATISWFNTLKINLNVETISAVQRQIEPVGNRGALGVRRRWGDYKNGYHKPVAAVVRLAEKKVPGSAAIINCLVWDSFRLDKSPISVAKGLLGSTTRLGDELLQRMMESPQTIYDPRWLRKRQKAMVAHGSLEGLAILTVCIRLTRDTRLAYGFYLYATDCLKTLGFWFYLNGIAHALGEYFEQVFLPMTGIPGCSSFYSGSYLATIKSMAQRVISKQENLGRECSDDEVISEMIRLVEQKIY
jgi:hypothetical protein